MKTMLKRYAKCLGKAGVRNTCTSEMTTIPDGGGYIGTMPYCKKNVSEGMLLDVQENTLAQAAKPIDKHKNKKATPHLRRSFFTRTQISVL